MSISLRIPAVTLVGLVLGASLALGGCASSQSSGSVSDSLGSFSDSSGSFSDSSTSSSGDDTAYRSDVGAYTLAHVRAGGSPEALARGLSEVALARGITDWEAIDATFTAVGAALAEAGVAPDQLVAFQHALARMDSPAYRSIARSYALARR